MMRIAAALLGALFLCQPSARADQLYVDAGADNPNLWLAKLKQWDPHAGMAIFTCAGAPANYAYSINLTRIESIVFQDDDGKYNPQTASCFPPTRQPGIMRTPAGRPKKWHSLLVSNDTQLMDESNAIEGLPANIKLVPDRDRKRLTLYGDIVSISDDEVGLSVLDKTSHGHPYRLSRDELLNWRR